MHEDREDKFGGGHVRERRQLGAYDEREVGAAHDMVDHHRRAVAFHVCQCGGDRRRRWEFDSSDGLRDFILQRHDKWVGW